MNFLFSGVWSFEDNSPLFMDTMLYIPYPSLPSSNKVSFMAQFVACFRVTCACCKLGCTITNNKQWTVDMHSATTEAMASGISASPGPSIAAALFPRVVVEVRLQVGTYTNFKICTLSLQPCQGSSFGPFGVSGIISIVYILITYYRLMRVEDPLPWIRNGDKPDARSPGS